MEFQKPTGQPKDPWLATRALHSTIPQVHGRTEETIQQEKPMQKLPQTNLKANLKARL